MTGFLLGLAVAVAAATGLYALWRRRVLAEIDEGAAVAYARYRAAEPHLVEGIDAARFREIYARATFPRLPKYLLACFAAFALALPATFGLLAGAIALGERLGMIEAPVALANYVLVDDTRDPAEVARREEMALHLADDFSGFYYFFGLLLAWLAVVAGFMRQYHARRPGSVRDELLRARADA